MKQKIEVSFGALEEIASENAGQIPGNTGPLSADDSKRLIHELKVHQIELEMQNEELLRAQSELNASRARRYRKQLFDTRKPQTCEIRFLRANSKPIWVRMNDTVTNDADGIPISRSVFIDITESREAEQRIAEISEFLQNFFDVSSLGIIAYEGTPNKVKVCYPNPIKPLRTFKFFSVLIIGPPSHSKTEKSHI